MKDVLVSIIIPTYNEERDISNCLDSLKKQSYKKIEIIIVDDGSTDSTIRIAKKFKDVRIFRQNHQGPGKARNLGAKESKGKILVFIDADMTFDNEYIKNLIFPLLKDKRKIIGTTHDYEIAVNTDNKWSVLWGKIRVSKEEAMNVKIFRAIRKNKFLFLGGFDQKYGYADDQTFWFKYKMKPIVAENTVCYHQNPSTLKETYKQAEWIGASWKERFAIFRIPLISHLCSIILFLIMPLFILIKSIKVKNENRINFSDILKFYAVKFYGYAIGVTQAIFLNKVCK